MHLQGKGDNLLTCQDLTVRVSHKLKFALYWKSQCFRFFHSELERKGVICFCPNTQTCFNCHDMKWYNNWIRRVTVIMNPTVWLSKYLVLLYYFMINLDATSLNICWKQCVFIRLLHAIPFLLSNKPLGYFKPHKCGKVTNTGLDSIHCCGAWCCPRSLW